MTRRSIRNSSNWRYRVIKRYKRRATHFLDIATSEEEKKAWLEVIKWFDTILNKRFVNSNGAIAIPKTVEGKPELKSGVGLVSA